MEADVLGRRAAVGVPGVRKRRVAFWRRLLTVFAYVIVLFLFGIYILPLLWIVLTSIKPQELIIVHPSEALAFVPTLDHYVRLVTEWHFLTPLLNSFIVSGATTVLNLILGVLASFALVRYRLRGGDFVSLWILSQRFMPAVAILLPLYIFYNTFGLIDTYLGMVLVNTVATLPFSIWMLRGFFQDLPKELYDQAEVDGCDDIGILRHVILPIGRAAMGVTAVFAFLFSFNELMIPLVISRTSTETVPVAFSGFKMQFQTDWGAAAAATVVTVLPLFIVVALLQENIIRGLSMGAVKE
ncbi:MAG: carbohydrate ABC transporter permease [Chloroflexi bacterium]|nr:carbohydrate ABC transporter permease [Chloroflexota bacterium]